MLIQKTFHVRRSLDETQKRLSETSSHLEALNTGNGFLAGIHLEQLSSEDPAQILFQSINSDVELTGLLELFSIRQELTEVQLTVNCVIQEPLPSICDGITLSLSRFVDQQLRAIRTWLETGILQTHLPRERRLRSRMGATPRQRQLVF